MIPLVFVDANVFFSAAYKSTGHARELLSLASRGIVDLITSTDVLADAREKLLEKVPNRINVLDDFLRNLFLTILPTPPDELVLGCVDYVSDFDDAFVLAAAVMGKSDYLVTWNKKDFKVNPRTGKVKGVKVVDPSEMVAILKKS